MRGRNEKKLQLSGLVHSVVCLATGPQTLPKRILYRARYSSSSVNFQYPLFFKVIQYLLMYSSWSSCRFYPSFFPSVTCFRIQFLCKTWGIQSAFIFFIVHKAFLSFLTLTILHFDAIGPNEFVGYSEKLGRNTNLSSHDLKGIEIFGYTDVERRLISTLLFT